MGVLVVVVGYVPVVGIPVRLVGEDDWLVEVPEGDVGLPDELIVEDDRT